MFTTYQPTNGDIAWYPAKSEENGGQADYGLNLVIDQSLASPLIEQIKAFAAEAFVPSVEGVKMPYREDKDGNVVFEVQEQPSPSPTSAGLTSPVSATFSRPDGRSFLSVEGNLEATENAGQSIKLYLGFMELNKFVQPVPEVLPDGFRVAPEGIGSAADCHLTLYPRQLWAQAPENTEDAQPRA